MGCLPSVSCSTDGSVYLVHYRRKCLSDVSCIIDESVYLVSRAQQMGVVAHEIGHALGLHHEQSRSDRDRYVRVNWLNMQSDMFVNFIRAFTDNFNTPYDYFSIMHYGMMVNL